MRMKGFRGRGLYQNDVPHRVLKWAATDGQRNDDFYIVFFVAHSLTAPTKQPSHLFNYIMTMGVCEMVINLCWFYNHLGHTLERGLWRRWIINFCWFVRKTEMCMLVSRLKILQLAIGSLSLQNNERYTPPPRMPSYTSCTCHVPRTPRSLVASMILGMGGLHNFSKFCFFVRNSHLVCARARCIKIYHQGELQYLWGKKIHHGTLNDAKQINAFTEKMEMCPRARVTHTDHCIKVLWTSQHNCGS